ncbi:MAG: hypothetical protein ACRDGA_10935, partial [Bacteroidota bacterium]
LILAMTAHFLNNALAVIVVYFGMEEEQLVSMGSAIEPTTSSVLLQLILFSLLFVLSLFAYLRSTIERVEGEGGE